MSLTSENHVFKNLIQLTELVHTYEEWCTLKLLTSQIEQRKEQQLPINVDKTNYVDMELEEEAGSDETTKIETEQVVEEPPEQVQSKLQWVSAQNSSFLLILN